MDNFSDFITSITAGFVFVGGTVVLVLGSYLAAHRLLKPGAEGDRTMEVAATVAVRIATLHGLVLGLVYAQELADYKDIRATILDEAVAVSDVWNDSARYGGEAQKAIQSGLAEYLETVVTEEWALLANHQGLSGKAWGQWDHVYGLILDLEPSTDRQRFLGQRMRDRVTTIARDRQIREAPSLSVFTGVFWTPALIGLVLVAAAFYVYRPSRTHILLIGLFGAYSGVILFFIYAFTNPYAAPGKIEPAAFEHLLQGDIGRSIHR